MNILISNIILDTPIIFSVFIFLINGWKKGLVKPFMNFLGGIIAFIISGFATFYLSLFIHNNFFKYFIIKKFNKIFLYSDMASFPKYILIILNFFGVSNFKISQMFGNFNSGEILFNIISPYVLNIIRLLIGSLLFGIIMCVYKKISKSFCSAFKIPVLAQFNSALGACFGFIKGIFIIWGIILFLKIILIYWNNPPRIFSKNIIKSTSIFVKFYDFNPVSSKFIAKIPFFKNTDILKYLM